MQNNVREVRQRVVTTMFSSEIYSVGYSVDPKNLSENGRPLAREEMCSVLHNSGLMNPKLGSKSEALQYAI